MEMLLVFIFTLVSSHVKCAANTGFSISTIGCSVHIQWNRGTYSEFYIIIRDEKDTNYFKIDTNRSRFTFSDVQTGQKYKITWLPIKNRERIENLTEERTVLVSSDCLLESSTIHPSTKETLNQKTTTGVPKTSSEFYFTMEMTTVFDKLGQNGFCTIQILVSLITIPIVIGIVMVLLYFCVARKLQGTKHKHQEKDHAAKSARVNVKSINYANDASYHYDEVEYSLVMDTET